MANTTLKNHPCRINGKAVLVSCRASGLRTALEVAQAIESAARAKGNGRETALERAGISNLELTWVPVAED